MKETIKLVTEGGSLALLIAVLLGLFYLARSVVPAIKDFFVALTTRLSEIKTDVEVIKTKVDQGTGAAASAYRSGGEAIGKVEDAVRVEAFELKDALGQAERRITAAIRREQSSDPPPLPASARGTVLAQRRLP